MVQPILSCLQDRNGDVRKAAQACLPPIVKSAGYDYVVAKCGDLKGAVKQTIMPMIEAVRPTGPSGPAAKKDNKKVKSRLAMPSGKDKAEEENMEDDEPPAKLPPGLVLKPSTNSTLNKSAVPLANPLAASNIGIPTNG